MYIHNSCPALHSNREPLCQIEEEEPDALDAFMADEVLPEVQAKAAADAAAREEARLKRAQERAVCTGPAVSEP